ncbi:MAG: hypothetical protein Q7Q71_09330 [Verrucomicrobiota bacterium JB023]|nr:hypothetical protein [Verrucomicrobiota bacterium JB023]
MDGNKLPFFEKLWASCYFRVRCPVEGVRLPDELAEKLARELMERLMSRYPTLPGRSEFSAALLDEAHEASRYHVRVDRRENGDHQLHHDPEDQRYERNLNLDHLQTREQGREGEREWNDLAPLLKPFGLAILHRKGVRDQDAEDVFMETFAELPRPKGSDNKAPIETIMVFEEVIPLFTKMLQFRAIDWRRKQSALKNQPNTQHSFDELTDNPDNARQFEDESARSFGDVAHLGFDRIYNLCEEALSPLEWELIFAIYVAQTHTMGELLQEEEILKKLSLKPSDSTSKKRRILNDLLHEALRKLAAALQN